MRINRRDLLLLGSLAALIGIIMAALIQQPGYTDAYYYFNAAARWVQGKGLTDAALWTYLGAPDHLPAPSHLYWMPLASLVEAAGMALAGVSFHAAQIPMILCYVGLVITGYGVGAYLGKSRRTAWLAGLLTLFSGLFMPYWTTTDTFALYGLVGALALVTMGIGRAQGGISWWALSGVLCSLAHLARADGLLLVIVLVVVALWAKRLPHPPAPSPLAERGSQHADLDSPLRLRRGVGGEAAFAAIGFFAYLLIMTPWFIRNLNTVGTLLPVGGFQTVWMRSYDEIANFPPGATLSNFMAWGVGNITGSRWEAFTTNVQTFVAVEGVIVLTPLMLIGLWRRRFDPFLSGFILYALGLHAAMTLIFAFPGPRGGLFHSASALVPFWAALGALGLDDVITWAAKRRRWPLQQARTIFGAALVGCAILLSALWFSGKLRDWNSASDDQVIASALPSGAVVMVNDPPAFYYHTGLSAVVVPNALPDVIPTIVSRYGVTHLILDSNRTAPMNDLYLGNTTPPFLKLLSDQNGIRIFEVIR